MDKDAELQIVARLKKESAVSTAPQKNILESIIAKIYWEYFQQNRWKYHQRSRTEDVINPDDFRTWDTHTMFEEIHRHFQRSLQDENVLMKTSLASINELIVEATNSRLYRPTVYDLLAYTAIDFYKTDEHSLTLGINRFVLKDTAYFSSFETMKLPEADTFSFQLNALKLYQKLLQFHKNRDTTAYVDAELQRLAFLMKAGSFEHDNQHYKNALRKISKENQHHPSSALADFEFASLLLREGSDYRPGENPEVQFSKKEALAYCDKAIKAFPGSHGAEKCAILRSRILDHAILIRTEKFIPINKPSFIRISYANTKSISFRAYPVSFEFYEDFWQQNDSTMLSRLQSIPVAAQWNIDLKDLQDYQQHIPK